VHKKEGRNKTWNIFVFFSFTYRAIFISHIWNQPSTRVQGRPGIEMKQKKFKQ